VRTSIRTRLLASLLVVAVASAAILSWYFLRELEAYGLRKLEERLGSEAFLMAKFVGETGADEPAAVGQALQEASEAVYSRLIVLDERGVAVADSAGDSEIGADYGERPEIIQALAGEYGAYTRVTEGGRVALYVAYPIERDGEIVGAAYSSAQTFSITTLIRDYRGRLLTLIAVFALVTLLLAEGLSRWLSKPLRVLESSATAFASGKHGVRVEPVGSRETRALGKAFNLMAEEVERMVSELKDEERRKSRFVSDVSHELRTPLTGIRGTAETLLEGDVAPEDEERFLMTIVRESDRLARLADDLLTLQRIEGATGELPLRRVDLREVAERAATALEHLTDMRGSTVAIEGDAPAVLGDPDRLQQVVANLIDNATRMMPEGGTVRVELGGFSGEALLSVLDEGPGIDEEAIAHIFDRFYRAQKSRDRSTGGAGLGLAIVKAIADAHAGRIEAANRPEGGTRFTLRLPAIREDR